MHGCNAKISASANSPERQWTLLLPSKLRLLLSKSGLASVALNKKHFAC
jgi:hypothetical protein